MPRDKDNLVLYSNHLSPCVRAVLMTALELDLEFDEVHLEADTDKKIKEQLYKINPQHTVPTLVDNGVAIWDSHAINAYLVRKYGKDDKLYPKDYAKRAIVDQRLHFDSGCFFNYLYQIAKPMWLSKSNKVPEEVAEKVRESYGHLETFLTDKEWVAGEEYTIADFSLLATATSLDIVVPIDAVKHPHIMAWIERAQSKPFYKGNEAVTEYRKVLEGFMARDL